MDCRGIVYLLYTLLIVRCSSSEDASRGNNRNRTKRASSDFYVTKWPGGKIYYQIYLHQFKPSEASEIREAMKVYERVTCLRFLPRYKEPHYIRIQNGKGCSSFLGLQKKGAQPVNLDENGCRVFGTYLHELGHALGLLHEHQRPVRDLHVRFFPTNLLPDMASQLHKYARHAVQTHNTQYDLASIMHYETTAFSLDAQSPTLAVADPWLARRVGRHHSRLLSFTDALTVNNMYNCNSHCDTKCPHGSYQDKHCKCIDQSAYDRAFCVNTAGLEAFCEELTVTGQCDRENPQHQTHCARACDLCPRIPPGTSGLAHTGVCRNQYRSDEQCIRWARANMCTLSPRFMHRQCRLACQACGSQIGKCPNTKSDLECDRAAGSGACQRDDDTGQFVRTVCQDSCGTCGYRRQGRCENKSSDAFCHQAALSYQCELSPYDMFLNCPKSCNRCGFNAGKCKNTSPDLACIKAGALNHCLAGPNKDTMLAQCQHTCNSCHK